MKVCGSNLQCEVVHILPKERHCNSFSIISVSDQYLYKGNYIILFFSFFFHPAANHLPTTAAAEPQGARYVGLHRERSDRAQPASAENRRVSLHLILCQPWVLLDNTHGSDI